MHRECGVYDAHKHLSNGIFRFYHNETYAMINMVRFPHSIYFVRFTFRQRRNTEAKILIFP